MDNRRRDGTGDRPADHRFGRATFSSYSIQHPTTSLAPGQYAVIVSNYAAFEERYNPAGTANILAARCRSGHLSNGVNTVHIYQVGNLESGSVAPSNGFMPSYRVDHINYNNAAPWPIQPACAGSAPIRISTADYGNDASNWEASNLGGTPGQANLPIDVSTPSIPANLAGQAILSPTAEISRTWIAFSDPQSGVSYYVIDRNGIQLGTSTTNSYADTTAVAGKNYTYSVSAVNRDGYASANRLRSSRICPASPPTTGWTASTSRSISTSR